MEVLIVGAGAMGRWFAEVVDAPVAFADVDPAAAEAAAERVGGRTVPLDGEERFQAVCVAVPIPEVEATVEAQAPRATDAMVDLSGTMAGPLAAMREHASDLERASLHPLFAPTNAPGRVAVVDDSPGPLVDGIREALVDRGNVVVETTPEEHDRAMETVQARAHAAVLAFALAAEDVPDEFGTPIYDGLRDLVAEVTGGTPRVYADIQEAFDGADDVAAAARRVADADRDSFERLFLDAGDGTR